MGTGWHGRSRRISTAPSPGPCYLRGASLRYLLGELWPRSDGVRPRLTFSHRWAGRARSPSGRGGGHSLDHARSSRGPNGGATNHGAIGRIRSVTRTFLP